MRRAGDRLRGELAGVGGSGVAAELQWGRTHRRSSEGSHGPFRAEP